MSENLRNYEIGYLFSTPEAEQKVIEVLRQCQSEILRHGELTKIDLAYPIKKQQSAYFGFIQFATFPENLDKIRTVLTLDAQVLRFLMTTLTLGGEGSRKRDVGGIKSQPLEESVAPPAVRPSQPDILSNAALEKKLEEILK